MRQRMLYSRFEMKDITLSMAPIQGITNYIFRNCFEKYFGGIEVYYAPYLRIDKARLFTDSKKRDILPENNNKINLIPQIMVNNPADFIQLAEYLNDLGYSSLNWNLGCPYPMVTNRKLGAGLLSDPDLIVEILDNVLPKIKQDVSIKLRTGLTDHSAIPDLLPRLNNYPLSEIIIHPRYARQMYKGIADTTLFSSLPDLTKHKVCYNGDITTLESFNKKQKEFTQIKDFMIGRGLIADPFLAQKIKVTVNIQPEEKKEIFKSFHAELFEKTVDKLSDPAMAVIHMKAYWEYFSNLFTNQHKVYKAIKKSNSPKKYKNAIARIFEEEELE